MLTAEAKRPVCSSAMPRRTSSLTRITFFVWMALTLAACQSAALQANQAQVEQQEVRREALDQAASASCPGNARAELNLGRAYEALNDKGQAMAHYQSAASSTDPAESAAETEAHNAIDRLGGSPR